MTLRLLNLAFGRRPLRCLLLLLGMVVSAGTDALATRACAQDVSTVSVGRYVAPDGSLQSAVRLELRGTKISGVTPLTEPVTGAYVDAVACPGLIDLCSSIGSFDQTHESKDAIDPAANALDGLDWHHRDFGTALSGGVTSAMLTPTRRNLVAGAAGVVKTDASGRIVLRADGPLVFSLGTSVWRYDRPPTSRTGSLSMMREVFDAAQRGQAHPRLNAVVKGGLSSLVYCDDAMDVSAALRLFGSVAGPNAIVHTGGEHDLVEELSGRGTVMVLGPFDFDTPPGALALAGVLSGKDVPVAFSGRIPVRGRDSLRLTAALAVRYGMAPESARRAMTIAAANVAGVANRIGSLEAGKDADFVIFSDDPLRLNASVLAVYVGGTCVYVNREAQRALSADEE